MCVWEREREREREKQGDRESSRERNALLYSKWSRSRWTGGEKSKSPSNWSRVGAHYHHILGRACKYVQDELEQRCSQRQKRIEWGQLCSLLYPVDPWGWVESQWCEHTVHLCWWDERQDHAVWGGDAGGQVGVVSKGAKWIVHLCWRHRWAAWSITLGWGESEGWYFVMIVVEWGKETKEKTSRREVSLEDKALVRTWVRQRWWKNSGGPWKRGAQGGESVAKKVPECKGRERSRWVEVSATFCRTVQQGKAGIAVLTRAGLETHVNFPVTWVSSILDFLLLGLLQTRLHQLTPTCPQSRGKTIGCYQDHGDAWRLWVGLISPSIWISPSAIFFPLIELRYSWFTMLHY